MKLRTLNDIFFAIARREQPQFVLRKTEAGWQPISSAEFTTKVLALSNAIRSWGISRGDRVAILSENRHEWVVADFACMLLGAIVVPIYTTLTPEQTAYILRDSGARVIFLSTATQLHKVLAIRHQTYLEKIVVMDAVADTGAFPMEEPASNDERNTDSLKSDPELEANAREIMDDEPAAIIYTSGTTGVPKGVMLTHGTMASN